MCRNGSPSEDEDGTGLVAQWFPEFWATEALRLYFVMQALGVTTGIGISGAFFVALIASLLTAVPFTPAGLGLVEVGVYGILVGLYHMPQHEAAAVVLVDRAISVLSIIIFGSIAYVLSDKTKVRPTTTVTTESPS